MGSHKCKDGWQAVWVTSLTLGPTITALPNRGIRDPCHQSKGPGPANVRAGQDERGMKGMGDGDGDGDGTCKGAVDSRLMRRRCGL
jgi:hypothetical protein